jgi:hypothetical protein
LLGLLLATLSPLLLMAGADTACGDSGPLTIENGTCGDSGVFAIDNGSCDQSGVFSIDNCQGSADFNGDGQVNLNDLPLLQACVSGPAVPLATGCAGRDLDRDGDVDQNDFGIFQRSFGPAGPNCAN